MSWAILEGDCRSVLATLPAGHFHCCVTSPPYWGLRDYGVDGQIGLEASVDAFVATMVDVFTGAWRVLRDDGVLWLNLGGSYASSGGAGVQGKHGECADRAAAIEGIREGRSIRAEASGLKPKDLCGVPWRVAFALQAAGWYLRDAVIWHKPNPMPGSQRDRCTSSYEFVFQLTKRARYFWDMEAIREEAVYGYRSQETAKPMEGRNAASSHVWRHAGNLEHEIERGPKETGVKYLGPETGRIPRNV